MIKKLIRILLGVVPFALSAQAGLYTGLSAGAFKSDDFKNYGGGAHVGYAFAQYCEGLCQGVEVEVWGLHGTGKRTETELATPSVAVQNARKVKLNQLPLMFNYRAWGCLSDTCFNWYAGAGLGVIFTSAKDHSHDTFYNATTGAVIPPPGNPDYNQTTHRSLFAGQVFAGLDYPIFDCLRAGVGARVIVMDKMSWSDPRSYSRATVKTDNFQVGLELSLSYVW